STISETTTTSSIGTGTTTITPVQTGSTISETTTTSSIGTGTTTITPEQTGSTISETTTTSSTGTGSTTMTPEQTGSTISETTTTSSTGTGSTTMTPEQTGSTISETTTTSSIGTGTTTITPGQTGSTISETTTTSSTGTGTTTMTPEQTGSTISEKTTTSSIGTGTTTITPGQTGSTISETTTTSSIGTGTTTITPEQTGSTISETTTTSSTGTGTSTITPGETGSTISETTATSSTGTGTTTITPAETVSKISETSTTSQIGTGTTTITPEQTGSTISETTTTSSTGTGTTTITPEQTGTTVSETTTTSSTGTGTTTMTPDQTGSTISETTTTSSTGTGTTTITPEQTGSTISETTTTSSIGTGTTTITPEQTGSTISETTTTSSTGTGSTTMTPEQTGSTISETTTTSSTGTGSTTMTPEQTGSTISETTTTSSIGTGTTTITPGQTGSTISETTTTSSTGTGTTTMTPEQTGSTISEKTTTSSIGTGTTTITPGQTGSTISETTTTSSIGTGTTTITPEQTGSTISETTTTSSTGTGTSTITPGETGSTISETTATSSTGTGTTTITPAETVSKISETSTTSQIGTGTTAVTREETGSTLSAIAGISSGGTATLTSYLNLSSTGSGSEVTTISSFPGTCCYDTNEASLITSGPFAGSVLDASALESLRYKRNRPQRIKERDDCCIARNGTVDWSSWCNLYYEIRPPSICDGYEPPSQAWFGGDPHILTSDNNGYSCNVFGSFIYAETTSDANSTANNNMSTGSTFLKPLQNNELFSIIARTSKTPSRLRLDQFFNQQITYFSSFSMYLGSNRDVIIDVDINSTNSYQFKVNYLLKNENRSINPFTTQYDLVEYYYYPTSLNDSSEFAFSISKENQTITAISWNTYSSNNKTLPVQIQVPKLTISIWSGLAMQCYVITNNMACTLLLPQKYYGNVRGLAFGVSTSDSSQYCANYSLVPNETEQQSLTSTSVLQWFNTAASISYQSYINNLACPMNKTSSTYYFCLQDTLLSQSPLLGQLTVKSSTDYQSANLFLSKNPPIVTLQSPASFNTPYTYFLTIRHNDTFQNQTNATINVIIDRNTSINVQIRDSNTSVPKDCTNQGSFYSCPFAYTNENRNQIQLTIIANDILNTLTTYQRIQLIVNECVNGRAIWNNPTILSSTVRVLFCICDEYYVDYCEKPVGCSDMTACVLNFLPSITCTTNRTEISINSTQTPYQCINNITLIPCSNDSACCKQGYQFHSDVQQCLFRPVCNETICGANNICQNTELKPNGYICMCNDGQIFDGTTCIQKKICNDASLYPNGILPCTGAFEQGIDSGNQCICQCRLGFTNSSNVCISTSTNITCNSTTNVCSNSSISSNVFCQYRTQTYNTITNTCQNTFCLNYCQNGTCSVGAQGYTCSCRPGTHLDYALNCAVCESGVAGPNCSLLCDCEFGQCNVNATSETDKCSCASGYTGLKCDQYINYCDPQNDTCNSVATNRVCKLTPTNHDRYKQENAYECPCKTGYQQVPGTDNCIDIDECAVASTTENICSADTTSCHNLNGSYSCACNSGYVKDNSTTTDACVDEDECTTDESACESYTNSYCVNLRPYFECRCRVGYAPDGDYNQMYAALKDNQTCKIYNKCAANRIDCGGGICVNNTNSNDLLPTCYCNNSLILIQLLVGKYDCICPSNTHYYNGGVCTILPNPALGLVGESTFLIRVSCNNGTAIIDEIIRRFNETFKWPYYITIRNNTADCDESNQQDLMFDIKTDNNITVQNDVFELLENITANLNLDLYSVELVKNVTSCYLIDLCALCGGDIKRGVCLPETGLSKCQCFHSTDSLRPYTGEFCYPAEPTLTSSSRWIPIVVGVLAGLAGLFCAITCCLLALAAWRRRRRHRPDDDELRIRRIWHLPRAQVPATVTAENVQTYLNSAASSLKTTSSVPEDSTLSSDRSTYRTTYDYDPNGTVNSEFFKQLDQNMGAKLRATIARPDINAVLSSLPTLTTSQSLSSSASITSNSDDPIDELDAIIDDEDITMTFHDPLDDLFQDNEMLEVINPNLKLPRPQIDSKPTGLFSVRYLVVFLIRHLSII
ncbi:unnamed protein product, partial [Rotaria sp. Silwood2]